MAMLHYRQHLISLLLILFFVFIVQSQSKAQTYFEVFNLGYNYSPDNTYENSDAKMTVKDINANLRVPVLFKNGDALMFGATANSLSLISKPDTIKDRFLSSALLQLGYNKKLGDKWQALLVALPKLSSDFKDISSEDFQYGGILLFTYTKNIKLKYKVGMYYNQEFWGPFIVPLLGFDWQPNDRWDIFGSLPISATASYHLTEKFNTGLYFQAPTSSYRLSENDRSAYLARATNELYWFNEYYITKNIVLQEKVTYSLGRSFRIYGRDDKVDAKISAFAIGDDRTQLNNDINNGLIFDVKLMFRVPNKK
jgi:hypothetical protein